MWAADRTLRTVLGKLRNRIPGRKHRFIRKFPSTQCSQIVQVLKVSPKHATRGYENLRWHGGCHVAQFCWIFAKQQCWLYDFTIPIRYGYARWENEASTVYVCTSLERVKASKPQQVFLLLSPFVWAATGMYHPNWGCLSTSSHPIKKSTQDWGFQLIGLLVDFKYSYSKHD